MNKQEFMAAIEDLLEIEPGGLRDDDPLNGLEGWDSLAVVSFIAMVDESFELTLSADKVHQAKTVRDLIDLVSGHLSS